MDEDYEDEKLIFNVDFTNKKLPNPFKNIE